MLRACDRMRANTLEELFVVAYYGSVGGLAAARSMALPERRWWFDRTEKALKQKNGEQEERPKGMGMQPTFPQPGGVQR